MPKLPALVRAARSSALAAAACGVLAAGLSAPAAWAHAHLQESVPAADAAVASAERIELRFSEPLIERFAKVTLSFLGADGQSAPAEVQGVALSFAAGGRGVIATPAQPLRPGRYQVAWRVVSTDTHPVKGQFRFTVK